MKLTILARGVIFMKSVKLKKVITSLWLWVPLNIITFIAGYVDNIDKFKLFTLDRAGAVLCVYGVVLMFFYSQFGPKLGALAEVVILEDGTQRIYMPGDEFKKHLYVGLGITILGTLTWGFGVPQ